MTPKPVPASCNERTMSENGDHAGGRDKHCRHSASPYGGRHPDDALLAVPLLSRRLVRSTLNQFYRITASNRCERRRPVCRISLPAPGPARAVRNGAVNGRLYLLTTPAPSPSPPRPGTRQRCPVCVVQLASCRFENGADRLIDGWLSTYGRTGAGKTPGRRAKSTRNQRARLASGLRELAAKTNISQQSDSRLAL